MSADLLSTAGMSGFRWLFEALDACGEEADAAGIGPDLPYTVLAPPPAFRGTIMDVYRAHVRELCTRWLAGAALAPKARRESMEHPTAAELLLAARDASLQAPLDRTGLALYERLWGLVLPDHPLDQPLGSERYPGQVDEVLGQLRGRHAARDWNGR